jgi:hypothetical protein
LLTLHISSPPVFRGVLSLVSIRVVYLDHYLSFFLLAVVLFVLLRFKASDLYIQTVLSDTG